MHFVKHIGVGSSIPSFKLLGEEWLARGDSTILKIVIKLSFAADYFSSWEKHGFIDKLPKPTQCSEMAWLELASSNRHQMLIKHSIYSPSCASFGVGYTQNILQFFFQNL